MFVFKFPQVIPIFVELRVSEVKHLHYTTNRETTFIQDNIHTG